MLLNYGATLEQVMNGGGDIVRGRRIVEYGHQREVEDGEWWDHMASPRRKNALEWLVKSNAYFWTSVASVGTILCVNAVTRSLRGVQEETAASLPVWSLIFSQVWLYTWGEEEEEVTVFGVVSLPPLLVPLAVLGAKGGSYQVPFMMGFFASLVACKVRHLKRRDGTPVLSYLHEKLQHVLHGRSDPQDDKASTLKSFILRRRSDRA
jgi:hypothetical protein